MKQLIFLWVKENGEAKQILVNDVMMILKHRCTEVEYEKIWMQNQIVFFFLLACGMVSYSSKPKLQLIFQNLSPQYIKVLINRIEWRNPVVVFVFTTLTGLISFDILSLSFRQLLIS